MNRPLPFRWNGEAMEAMRPKEADAAFVIGEVYWMAPYDDRSFVSHGHQFAWLKEAWASLPEKIAQEYPSPEHLRKRALIEAGFFDEMIVDAGTNAAALRVASAFRALDDFAAVVVKGAFVIRRTAKSQSRRSMDKGDFQASKTAVMEIVAQMLGVEVAMLPQTRAP